MAQSRLYADRPLSSIPVRRRGLIRARRGIVGGEVVEFGIVRFVPVGGDGRCVRKLPEVSVVNAGHRVAAEIRQGDDGRFFVFGGRLPGIG